MRIIDFHTHPFESDDYNICRNIPYCHMSAENTERDLRAMGMTHIVGCVAKRTDDFAEVVRQNDQALRLRDYYRGFYIPGIHVHPGFVTESIAELKRLHREGVRVIGELVPYFHGWRECDYGSDALSEILDYAAEFDMIVSFHGIARHDENVEASIDRMVAAHPTVTFVGAHVGMGEVLEPHVRRMKRYPNYMVDLSGDGLQRHGVLRHLIDEGGLDRILFGSDYPVCNPAAYIGGVMLDFLITEEEKKAIMYDNAARLLRIVEN